MECILILCVYVYAVCMCVCVCVCVCVCLAFMCACVDVCGMCVAHAHGLRAKNLLFAYKVLFLQEHP